MLKKKSILISSALLITFIISGCQSISGRIDTDKCDAEKQAGTMTPIINEMMSGEILTFYISPVGSDHNQGTIANPFKTLERARKVSVVSVNSNRTD